MTPVVNIVGDHATYHAKYDAPLQSDIARSPAGVSGWVHSSTDAATVADDVTAAVAAAIGPPGQVATLILPADVDLARRRHRRPPPIPQPVDRRRLHDRRDRRGAPAGEPAALLVGGRLRAEGPLADPGRISATIGAKLLSEVFPTRVERGAGVVGGRAAGIPRGVRPAATRRPVPPRSWSTRPHRFRSSPIRTRPAIWCRRDAPSTPSPRPGRRRRRALAALAAGSWRG